MNKFACFLSCLCGLSSLHGQQLLQQSFVGSVTGDTVKFNIYLPNGYDTSPTGFPVVYHLHGIGGNQGGNQNTSVPAAFVDALQMGLVAEKYIIVFPNGMVNSMWADSKSGHKPVETQVIQELIPYVDAHFNTIPDRNNRYIQGFSMGGFGAAKFISKYPTMFQSAVIFDGALHNWQTFNANHADLAAEIFDNDEAYFMQFSPWNLIQENAAVLADSACIRLAVGALTQYNRPFRDSLMVWGIPFEYLETTCGHNLGCLLGQDGLNAVVFQENCYQSSVLTKSPLQGKAAPLFYPNPVDNVLFWESKNVFLPEQTLLFDGRGKLLREVVGADVLADGLDVSGLPSGVFFVGVRTAQGLLFQKIIKI